MELSVLIAERPGLAGKALKTLDIIMVAMDLFYNVEFLRFFNAVQICCNNQR